MGIITTGNFPASLVPGAHKFFGLGYAEQPTCWDKIVSVETSRKSYEVDYLVTGLGLPQVKPQGQSISYDDMKQNWQVKYVHVTYGLGMIVTREEIDDDLYDNVTKNRAMALGRAFRLNKEIVVANLLNNAFSTSVQPAYADGQPLISSAHPLSTGGTLSNQPANAGNLSESILEQAMTDIRLFVDDRGLRIYPKAQRLHIHPQNLFNAARILESPLQNDTSDNAINVLRSRGYIEEVIDNPFLTSTKAWFVTTDIPEGLKLFQRWDLQFGQDNDFDTENAKFKAMERYSVGASDTPRCIYGSAGI